MGMVEPRLEGFIPESPTKSNLLVRNASEALHKVFDSDGELYTPDGAKVSERLTVLEAGIPPLDDARIVVLENAKAQNDIDVPGLQGRMTAAEGDIDALETTVAAEQLLLDQAQTDIVNLQGDMTTAKSDIDAVEADMVTAKADISTLKNDVDSVEATVSGHTTSIAMADAKAVAAQADVDAHSALTNNPHNVTAGQVNLGNVTNESKATMFTNAALTGVPTAPTAVAGTNTTQIATTAFDKASMDAHVAASDPHAQYLKEADLTAANVGAYPIPDAGGYYSTDTINGAFQSVGAQLAQHTSQLATIANQAVSPVFGVKFALASSNPVGTRTDAAVGFTFTPGVGVAGASSFDGYSVYDLKLCNRAAGVVTAYYGEPGFSTANDTFVEIPSGYYKRWTDATYEYYQISKSEFPGSKLHNCFKRGGKVKDYVYLAAYKASYDGASKHESKSGTLPDVSVSRTTSRTRSRARGTYASIQDIHARDWLALLFVVETASRDSQTVLSRGCVDMPYSATHVATVAENAVNRIVLANAFADAFVVGQEMSIGTSLGSNDVAADRTVSSIDVYDASNKAITFTGAAVNIALGNIAWTSRQKNGKTNAIAQGSGVATGTSGKAAIRYRGVENPWGNVWEWVDNLNICDNQGYSDPNGRIDLYSDTDFGTNYTPYAAKFPSVNGYFKRPMMDAATGVGCLPSDVTGGSTAYFSDYHYQSAGDRASVVGGFWGSGSSAGLWYWNLNYAESLTGIFVGSRLLEIPA